jgi:acid phosphatase type 7
MCCSRCRPKHSENPPFWYAYDFGSVHFVTVSSEHSLGFGSVQYRWLVEHLAGIDRCRTPWVVLGIHRPMYVIRPHRLNRRVARHFRAQFEDVLIKYGVDAVISGHVHSYSRSCPVIHRKCTPFKHGGILHVIAGSGGHKLSTIKKKQPKWVAAAERAFGFVRVKVSTSLELSLTTCMSVMCMLRMHAKRPPLKV